MQDSGFAEMLYDINWEVFPLDIQKTNMYLIYRKQNVKGPSMGRFGVTINRELFNIVSRSQKVRILYKISCSIQLKFSGYKQDLRFRHVFEGYGQLSGNILNEFEDQ